MPQAEAHPTDNADGHRILINSLLGADITFHGQSSLFKVNEAIFNFYHGKGKKSKNIIKLLAG
jgi:hypothetical protein